MPRDEDEIRDAMASAIADALGADYMLGRWTLIAEVVEAETGERVMWTQSAEDQKRWETIGMATWAIQIEQASQVGE
jgi:hypothetical protein